MPHGTTGRAAVGRTAKVIFSLIAILFVAILVAGAILLTRPADTSTDSAQGADIVGDASPAAAPTTAPDASQASELTTPSTSQLGSWDIDPTWVTKVSSQAGIPARALVAYAGATAKINREQTECGLSWNTLAAIGQVESNHGRENGSEIQPDGNTSKKIIGVQLNGITTGNIPDTDKGELDGDKEYDRAVGPMQFIPSTWRQFARDGNGDRTADPNNIDDATVTAASYLCSTGTLKTDAGWTKAILAYNNSDVYVQQVLSVANSIATAASR